MTKNKGDGLIEAASPRTNAEVTRVVAYISLGIAVVLFAIYLRLFDFHKFVEHFAPEVILAGLLFTVGYFLFLQRGILIGEKHIMKSRITADYVKEFFIEHDDVDWDDVIRKASEIDIVVFYYDSWVKTHYRSFVDFFRNKGRLSLILSNPDDETLVSVMQKYFFPVKTAKRLQEKITATRDALVDAQEESGQNEAQFQTYYFNGLLHYSFVLVDRHQLYLSVYEQFRGKNVRSSVFRIDLRSDNELQKYWLNNLNDFKKNSTHPAPWRRAA